MKRILCVLLTVTMLLSLLGMVSVSAKGLLTPIADPDQAAGSNLSMYLYAEDGDGVCHYMRQTRTASASEHGYAEKVTTTSPYSLYTTTSIDEAAVYCVKPVTCEGATEYMLQLHDAAANKDYVLYILTSGVGPNSLTGTTHAKHHFLWDAENKRFYQMEGNVQYVLVMKNMKATYAKTSSLPAMSQNEWRITCAPVSQLGESGVYPVTLGCFDHTHVFDVPTQIPGSEQHRLDCACGEEGTQLVTHSFADGVCVCGKREGFSLREGVYYLTGKVNGQSYYFRKTVTGESVTHTTPYSVCSTTDRSAATLVDVILESDGGFSLAYPYNDTLARIYVYDVGNNGSIDTGVNTAHVQANHHFTWDEENAYFYQMEGQIKYVLAFKELKNNNTGVSEYRVQAVPESELSATVVPVSAEAHTEHSCDSWTVQTPATTTTPGVKIGTCTICGRQLQGEIPVLCPEFSGKSISLKDDFSIGFYVEKAAFTDGVYTDPYAVFQLDGKEKTVSAYTEKDGYYVFSFDSITPDQMGKTVTATLYADKSDGTKVSSTTQYSVAQYCYDALQLEQSPDAMKRLLVDLLNYGAAAQLYRNSAADPLVNAALTQEQKNWATTGQLRALNSVRSVENTMEAPEATWHLVSLVLTDSIRIRVCFKTADAAGLRICATDDTGNQWVLSDIKTRDDYYYADFDCLSPAQMGEHIAFSVMDGDRQVSDLLHYSIESYADVMLRDPNKSQQLKTLVDAIIRYGDAAKAYVEQVYDLNSDVNYFGRTYALDGAQWFNWSASGFSVSFQGSGLKANIASNAPDSTNYAYLKVYVDGEEQPDILLNQTEQTVTLAAGLDPAQTHTVEVRKRNSPRSSTAGLLWLELLDGKKLAAPAAKEKLIEFVGDSLTVGYSAADTDKSESAWSTKTEDATKTYAKQVADAFDAEYMVTAISGRGVVMNNSGGSGYVLPEVYPQLDIYNIPGTAYDFALQPDVVVINLGTNDATNADLDLTAFREGVVSFIKTVRQHNPKAQIIWAYGLRSDKLTAQVAQAIEAAVAQINSEGDSKVYYLPLALATDMHLNHPTAAAYGPSGEKLIDIIEEITGW